MLRRLRRWAEKIGRWLVEEIYAAGCVALSNYLAVRARKFDRQARAASGRRKKWLTSRARRWKRCAAFLREHADDIGHALTRETMRWVTEGLDDEAADERFSPATRA